MGLFVAGWRPISSWMTTRERSGSRPGTPSQASLVLSAAAEREGRRLFAVVMGSEGAGGHFVDADVLLDYGFDEARIPTTVSEIDLNGPLGLRARGEAIGWLAASDLLVPPPPPSPTLTTVLRQPEQPDWRDASGLGEPLLEPDHRWRLNRP